MKVKVISETEYTAQAHGVHTAYLELTNALKAREDMEVAVNTRGRADILHVHTVGPLSLFHLLTSRAKKVISAHVVPDSFVGSLKGTKYWLPLATRYLRWFYNRADVVLAVSDETKRQLLKLGVTKRIEIFYNVIDTAQYRHTPEERQAARQALGIDQHTWLVMGAGQVQPRKGIATMVACAEKLPDVMFSWVGGMPFGKIAADTAEMQHIMDHPPTNMRFPGIVPLAEMRQYYRAADMFFLPSTQETFGLVVVEAAASGLPIMLRDIHDYDETFRPYSLMADENTFAESIVRLRDDPQLYARMVEKAHELAATYDSHNGAERLSKLYAELLAK